MQTNERGNVVLGSAEELTVFDGAGAAAFVIAVDRVDTAVVCTAAPGSAPAVNGHLIALHVRVTTGTDLSVLGAAPAIRAADFRALSADGVTLTETATPSAASCLPDEVSLPTGPLTPAEVRTGTVVLDVATTTGTVVFAPGFLTVGAEWAYA